MANREVGKYKNKRGKVNKTQIIFGKVGQQVRNLYELHDRIPEDSEVVISSHVVLSVTVLLYFETVLCCVFLRRWILGMAGILLAQGGPNLGAMTPRGATGYFLGGMEQYENYGVELN